MFFTARIRQIINVEQEHILPGQVPSWTPNGLKRQWFTRLEYLARSPYEVLLILSACLWGRSNVELRSGATGGGGGVS